MIEFSLLNCGKKNRTVFPWERVGTATVDGGAARGTKASARKLQFTGTFHIQTLGAYSYVPFCFGAFNFALDCPYLVPRYVFTILNVS